ncbi:MAG: preprotein translocase subunit SecE [Pseudomonadales bacterium]|jgi:preprotein translocase subunit SecE|nr:preprotein translocase subunit SecE [Pseudomonadales bacterium]
MSAAPKNEPRRSGLDGLKWAVVVLLVAGGVVGNAYYADQSLLYRVLALVGVALVAALVAVQTTQGRAFWELVGEARVEIRKVVWPSRQETTQTTLVVLALVFVVSLILWGLDSGLGWIVSSVIG